MRKKTIAKRAPREKVFKLPTKPSTRSQDRTFTPSPSPPTSPHRCDPMARTKNTPRFPASVKLTPPPKATPSKPGSSKPSSTKPGSSKGKHQATEEPIPEPTQPKSRSVPMCSQRAKLSINSVLYGHSVDNVSPQYSSGDESNEQDLFASVGGMDLGHDNSSSSGQKNSEFHDEACKGKFELYNASVTKEHPIQKLKGKLDLLIHLI
nr:swi5-dependent recombination DNA repair protein 1 homolog [Arachis hypogaea]